MSGGSPAEREAGRIVVRGDVAIAEAVVRKVGEVAGKEVILLISYRKNGEWITYQRNLEATPEDVERTIAVIREIYEESGGDFILAIFSDPEVGAAGRAVAAAAAGGSGSHHWGSTHHHHHH
uniref:LNG binder n=1 Tax=synthetic construct TaxID=32630 RepID=UPI003624AC7E